MKPNTSRKISPQLCWLLGGKGFAAPYLLALFLLVGYCGVGCGGGGGGGGSDDQNLTNTFFRVIHAIPDSPKFDVSIDGIDSFNSVAYGAGTDYIMVEPGTRTVEIQAAGTSFTLLESDVRIAKETGVTAIAVNFLQFVELITVEDDLSRPLAGNTKIRLINAALGVASVDIYMTARNADLSSATPIITNASFKDVTEYLTIPSGDYRLRVTVAGTKSELFDSGTISISSRGFVSILFLDAVGGGEPFQAQLIEN